MKKYAYAITPIVIALAFVVVLSLSFFHTDPDINELKVVKKWLREKSNNPKALEILHIEKIRESQLPSAIFNRVSSNAIEILDSFLVTLRYENMYGAIRSDVFYVFDIKDIQFPTLSGYVVYTYQGKVFTDY